MLRRGARLLRQGCRLFVYDIPFKDMDTSYVIFSEANGKSEHRFAITPENREEVLDLAGKNMANNQYNVTYVKAGETGRNFYGRDASAQEKMNAVTALFKFEAPEPLRILLPALQ